MVSRHSSHPFECRRRQLLLLGKDPSVAGDQTVLEVNYPSEILINFGGVHHAVPSDEFFCKLNKKTSAEENQ